MKFLIVNAYSLCSSGFKYSEQFRQLIYDISLQVKEIADIEIEFIVVDRYGVEDYLFEPETSLVKPQNGLKFDSIDMIFINASPNTRPWNSSMRNIITLIRMCIKSKKLLFMTSFGAQALAYICASNIQGNIHVTNGNGEGCKLVDFPKYTVQALKNGLDDFFLDSTTGDLYCYNKQTDEWIPRANLGIHHRRDAMEFQTIGKFVVKSPTYKPKQQMLSNQTEMTCVIRKQFLHNWLFKDIQMEFNIKQFNSWDIHPITFTNPYKKFQVLAENNIRGPLILQCENIIAILFEIEIKNKDEVALLKNFIENGIKLVRYSDNYNRVSITQEKYYNNYSAPSGIEIVYKKRVSNLNRPHSDGKLKLQAVSYRKHLNTAIQEAERDKGILHVGFSVKKNRLPDFVEHNNIVQKTFKVDRGKSFSTKQQQIKKLSSQINNYEFLSQNLNINKIYETPTVKTNNRKYIKSDRKKLENDDSFEKIIQKEKQEHTLTQMEVRKTLHPDLDEQFLGTDKIWIPGFLKQNRQQRMSAQSLRSSEKL